MNIVTEKQCTKCGETKALSDFVPNKYCRDGYEGRCKKCESDYQKTYRKEKLETLKAKSKHYRETHKTEIQANHKAYRELKRDEINQHAKEYRKSNPDKIRNGDLRQYGITSQDYNEMLKSQDGGCAICSGVNRNGKPLFVDHDHNTGVVRGLLCAGCNYAIGHARDDVNILQKAIRYLLGSKVKTQ